MLDYMSDDDEVEKKQIYKGLDDILDNLEVLEKKTNKEKVSYLLHIQIIQTKLLYNALKDIDDLQDSIVAIIKTIRKTVSDEDLEYGDLEEEMPTNEKDLKKIKSEIEKKTYDIGKFYS